MKTNILVIAATSLLLILAGCRSAPILNIENTPIVISAKHSSKDIKKAIVYSGTALGWNMNSNKEGFILGTLFMGKHTAIVDINYSKNQYSITYRDSQNLNYDGANIHRNYNIWIQNLNRYIQAQLSTL